MVAIVAYALACTPAAPSVRRIDEDGVEIVVSERPRWDAGEGWRLTPQPETAIGEDVGDPAYLFSAIRGQLPGGWGFLGPTRLPDGQLVAGDVLSKEVRFFDPAGVHVRTVGGRGEGPGEFNNLNELHQCVPGIIYAIDVYGGTLTGIDAAGRSTDRVHYEQNVGTDLYTPLTCSRSGQVLGMDWGDEQDSRRDGLYRTTVHMWLLDAEGFVLRDLGGFAGVERIGSGRGSAPHPLGKTPAFALGVDRAYIGTADTFEIEVRSLDGTLLRKMRRPSDDLTITGADIERYIEVLSEDLEAAEEVRSLRVEVNTMPMPETFPAYTRFVLDATDHLWVENYRKPGEERVLWSVFDPQSEWLGEVEVPPRLEVSEIGADYVLGVFRDELDEQSVRLYGLLK